ncbi:terminase small subunit [Mycobacterium phage Traaww1]|uniref:Terminase small subunit n=2 Tax=Kostyavirus porky TaxID=546185 RepID=A0A385DNG7_9CAUD|nr:terminase small subunit [Mycobacterium phage Emmina]QGJ91827.1 terminase small subunit [Mycobacterium phage Traaww1]
MGKRGPKPRPNHLKALEGVEERYMNRDEPIPAEGEIVPPDMSDGAREVWDELAEDLADKGCLKPWDVYMFAVFCEAVATYRACRKMMGHEYTAIGAAGGVIKSPYWQIMRDCATTMAQYSGRFGLTPGDRASLQLGGEGEQDGPKNGAERLLG